MSAPDRLAELATEIREHRARLIDDERDAFDLCEGTAIERAMVTRGLLEARLLDYFEESERRRAAMPARAA